jgi:clan AA aspartic protease (TIGR02281 family)
MRTALVCGVVVSLLAASASHADVYRWVDASGRPHFTTEIHEVPADQRAAAERAAAAPKLPAGTLKGPGRASAASGSPASLVPAASTPRRSGSAGRVYTVEVERAGASMLVAVRLNDRVTAPFLIDTGATDVLLPQAVADQLGVEIGPDTRRVRYQTANGVVENPVITLDSVDLGGARVEGVPASVSPSLSVGLLGLSFFNHFKYEVDTAQGVVRLRPNELAEQGLIRGGRSEAQWRAEFASLDARRRGVEEALGDTQTSHGRERARLASLLVDLDRDLALLGGEADQAKVPGAWRQ